MQIAGNKCRVCGSPIVFSEEGKFCEHCGTVVHHQCDSSSKCPVCRRPYAYYELVQPDPLRDGILPRALRPAKSYGPVFAICAVLLTLIFMLLIIIAFSAGA